MRHLFTLLFAIAVCLQSAHAQSTRKLPYPIIFVHGLGGNDESWYDFAEFLRDKQGLTAYTLYYVDANGKKTGRGRAGTESRLTFNLNADNNLYSSDANTDYVDKVDESKLGSNDIYIINFGLETSGL